MDRKGQILHGTQYIPRGNLTLPFTEQVFDYTGKTSNRVTGKENITGSDLTPLDEAAAKFRLYDLAAVAVAYNAEWIIAPWKGRVDVLPDVLTSVTATFNKTVGNGTSNHPASQMEISIVNAGGGSANPRSSNQGSAAILPVITWNINRYSNRVVDGIDYYFYLTQETTLAAVLAKLSAKVAASVTSLPLFKLDDNLQVIGLGMSVSVKASADTQVGLSYTNGVASSVASFEYGDDKSKEVGVTTHVENIPPCIHAAITISSNTDSQAVTATAQANTSHLVIGVTEYVPAITNEPTAVSATASASVKFSNGSATSGATSETDIPKTGLKLVELSSESDEEYGFLKVHARVVDMSQYA